MIRVIHIQHTLVGEGENIDLLQPCAEIVLLKGQVQKPQVVEFQLDFVVY